jgi:SAM-dependent methyltransferase
MATPIATGSAFLREVGRSVFGSDVEGYHSVRPGYPNDLFEMIAERVNLRDRFGEIGPGTGLASAGLMGLQPRSFVAFEPDAYLAEFLRNRFPSIDIAHEDFCEAKVAGNFNLIAAASSFHWLDEDRALRKAHDLLAPDGCLSIWWNVYREAGIGDAFAEAVTPLLSNLDLPPSQTVEHHYGLDQEHHFDRLRSTGFSDVEYRLFRRERILTAAEARALYSTFSLVRVLAEPRRKALLDAIEGIVLDRFGGAAPSVLLTPIYIARKRFH